MLTALSLYKNICSSKTIKFELSVLPKLDIVLKDKFRKYGLFGINAPSCFVFHLKFYNILKLLIVCIWGQCVL